MNYTIQRLTANIATVLLVSHLVMVQRLDMHQNSDKGRTNLCRTVTDMLSHANQSVLITTDQSKQGKFMQAQNP